MSSPENNPAGESPFEADVEMLTSADTVKKGCGPSGCLLAVLICALTFILLLAVLAFTLLPAINAYHEAQRREECMKNLEKIGEAARNFNEEYREIPSMPPIEENNDVSKQLENFMDIPEESKGPRVSVPLRENNKQKRIR